MLRDGEPDWGQRLPCRPKKPRTRGSLGWRWDGYCSSASWSPSLREASKLVVALCQGQEHPHGRSPPSLGSGNHTDLTLQGEGACSECLSFVVPSHNSNERSGIQSEMRQGICSLFGLIVGSRLKFLVSRRHRMKLAGGRALSPLLLGQEILTQTKAFP